MNDGKPTIDLRSDTVTSPTASMREAMAVAKVGDDVYGEDPTVNRLEKIAAERMGKAAAILVPSGTMANLLALLSHCNPGDEVLLGEMAHIVRAEVGGAARIGGITLTPLPNLSNGSIEEKRLRSSVQGANVHHPPTRLLALENTHNFCGGRVLSIESIRSLTDTAKELGLLTHMDGARIFNAQVALGTPAAELVKTVDSVSFCLSKGLSAPIGSLLCGSSEFVMKARKLRKMLGGGMRQAGIIAAAGIIALEEMVDRITDDHANAKYLAEGLVNLGYNVKIDDVESNIVVVPVENSKAFQQDLADQGILVTVLSDQLSRFVTHANVSKSSIDEALVRIREARLIPV